MEQSSGNRGKSEQERDVAVPDSLGEGVAAKDGVDEADYGRHLSSLSAGEGATAK